MVIIKRLLEWMRTLARRPARQRKEGGGRHLPDPMIEESGMRRMTITGSFPTGAILDKKTRLRLFFVFSTDRPETVYVVLNREMTAVKNGEEEKHTQAIKVRILTKRQLEEETYAGLIETGRPVSEEFVARQEIKRLRERGYALICKIDIGEESGRAIQEGNGRISRQFINALFDRNVAALRELCGKGTVQMHW